MNSIYQDNPEISLFINRAQNKIADLASLVVDRGGDAITQLKALLELANFLECLDTKEYNYDLNTVIKWVQTYTYRYELTSIPYLNILGYQSIVIVDGDNKITLPIVTGNLPDYIPSTNEVIRNFQHNGLAGLQGGTTTERYHVTKQMYDYLSNLLNPSAPSSIDLLIGNLSTIWPSGYYELGTSIAGISLQGSINYGTATSVAFYEYRKNNLLLGVRVTNPDPTSQPNLYVDNTSNSTNVIYSFITRINNQDYVVSKTITFKQPMYYGLIKFKDVSNLTKASAGTKDVRDKGEITLSFNIPVDNTLLVKNEALTPYLFIPGEWGRFITAMNGIFDFAPDWISSTGNMVLADGSTQPGLMIYYNAQIEGSTSFKFNW